MLASIPNVATEYVWVEPSAGSGAFLRAFPDEVKQAYAMDIEPDTPGIVCQDYLQWFPPKHHRYLVIGNPPFGRQSSMAKRFIRASCAFADVVAFILPRSFTKPSMYSAFPTLFHLVKQFELPNDSFLLNGAPYDVPCVFQVWQKKNTMRPIVSTEQPIGFSYVKPDQPHHICVRRVGVYAGTCYKQGTKQCSPSSHYFVSLDDPRNLDAIVATLNQINYNENTVGARSISKPEFNSVMNETVRVCQQSLPWPSS